MQDSNSYKIEDVWKRWIEHRDQQAANDIVTHYMYLVHYHVERFASYMPNNVDKDDLKSMGLMGLFDALNKFDPARKLQFDTYASIRVRGAIYDGLRKEDWLPRTLREQTKKIDKVYQELEQKLHREPTTEEIAKWLDIDVVEVETAMSDALFANVLSMDMPVKNDEMNGASALGATIVSEEILLPPDYVVDMELKQHLTASIQKLNHNEQLVISLFYVEELTLTEIGEVLSLSTSRISQIHKKAISKLRTILQQLTALP